MAINIPLFAAVRSIKRLLGSCCSRSCPGQCLGQLINLLWFARGMRVIRPARRFPCQLGDDLFPSECSRGRVLFRSPLAQRRRRKKNVNLTFSILGLQNPKPSPEQLHLRTEQEEEETQSRSCVDVFTATFTSFLPHQLWSLWTREPLSSGGGRRTRLASV